MNENCFIGILLAKVDKWIRWLPSTNSFYQNSLN